MHLLARANSVLNRHLFATIDIAPLVFFRIAFGALMVWEVWRYFFYDRVFRYYVEPDFFFHYYGFEWVRPLPGDGMFYLFYFLGFLSTLIMIGAFYRLSMVLFWLCFTYIFLLDQAQYLNHFYLVSLLSFLMIFMPLHRAFSVDALLRRSIRTQTVPFWGLAVLRAQMALVYIFGGFAKINEDWVRGEPLRGWMASAASDFPIIGQWLTEEWMVYLFSFGGMLLDLFIVPLLLWKVTRIPALILAILFHLTNAQMLNIGIFPWLSIAITLIFMPPHWFRLGRQIVPAEAATARPSTLSQRWLTIGIVVYFAVQIWLPLRHWLYPGNPSWTEEGHNLAWQMRLREKRGEIRFFVSDPAAGTTQYYPVESLLSERQFDQMKDNPHMILRFAHYLARRFEAEGMEGAQVRAWSMMSLNQRAPQLLVDPLADLARQPDHLLPANWILPLTQDPIPNAPVPTLLVSQRYERALVLLNAADTPFSLSDLRLNAGLMVINADSLGVETLQAGECLLIHQQSAPLDLIFMPCNEAGSRLTVTDGAWDAGISVQYGDVTLNCNQPVCMVEDRRGA